jgi:hypothetical protein
MDDDEVGHDQAAGSGAGEMEEYSEGKYDGPSDAHYGRADGGAENVIEVTIHNGTLVLLLPSPSRPRSPAVVYDGEQCRTAWQPALVMYKSLPIVPCPRRLRVYHDCFVRVHLAVVVLPT